MSRIIPFERCLSPTFQAPEPRSISQRAPRERGDDVPFEVRCSRCGTWAPEWRRPAECRTKTCQPKETG